MFDTEAFIQIIEENPPIWERSSSEYKERGAKEICWLNVGAGLFENWDEMSDAEKQSQVKLLKNKWRHIRDNYAKYVSRGRSGDPALKKKKYVYADSLSFLLPQMEKRGSTGDVDTEFVMWDEEDTSDVEHPDTEVSSAADYPRSKSFTKSKFKNTRMSSQQKSEQSDQNPDDPDKAFFMSILPNVKNLDDDEKLDFRCHVLQFFRDRRIKKTSDAL